MMKCNYLLIVPEPTSIISAQELKAILPTIDELHALNNAGLPQPLFSMINATGSSNYTTYSARVLERFELFSEAIEYARATMTSDLSRSGAMARKDSDDYPPVWMHMGMLIARCIAHLGDLAEAKAGFEAVAENATKSGLYLLQIQAL
eukprot:COSAG01_NODE_41974_length_445_cov_0.552023_1_plen_147_part_11